MKRINLISIPPRTIFLVIIVYSLRNSKEQVMFGSWNLSEKVRAKVYFFLTNFSISHNGKTSFVGSQRVLKQSLTLYKDILWTHFLSEVRNLIWEFMFSFLELIHSRFTSSMMDWLDLPRINMWAQKKVISIIYLCIWQIIPSIRIVPVLCKMIMLMVEAKVPTSQVINVVWKRSIEYWNRKGIRRPSWRKMSTIWLSRP